MFNLGAYENSRPDGISVLEVLGENEDSAPRRFVPLRRTELRGEVAGPLASLRLTQVFRFAREECDQVLETVYRFPLPGDAAVTGVCVRFGDAEIRADLKERQRAEKDYEKAKEEGRQAALLTRESPDVFTLQVAGVAPDQDVSVETSYVQLARAEGPGWSLRLPLTTAPIVIRNYTSYPIGTTWRSPFLRNYRGTGAGASPLPGRSHGCKEKTEGEPQDCRQGPRGPGVCPGARYQGGRLD